MFISDGNYWYLLYTEQRDGHGYIWQQKFNKIFDLNYRLQHNATQVFIILLEFFNKLISNRYGHLLFLIILQ